MLFSGDYKSFLQLELNLKVKLVFFKFINFSFIIYNGVVPMGLLNKLVDKIIQYSPEIEVPLREIPLHERIANTTLALLFFMILSEVLLPSVDPAKITEARMLEYIMGTAKGTLFTVGIYPIVMGGFLVQLLFLFKVLDIDSTNPKELDKVEKFKHIVTVAFILLISLSQALALSYSTPSAILFSFAMFTLGGFILMLLVDYIDKYGFYSGISLIILLRASKSIFVYLFNPISEPDYGLLTKLLFTLQGREEFSRMPLDYLLIPVLGTIGIFLLLVFLHSAKVVIARQTPNPKLRRILPKREHSLLFLSVVPLILGSMILESIRMLATVFGDLLVHFGYEIGKTITYKTTYWLTPPYGWINFSLNPWRAVVYYGVLFIITYTITYIYLFFSNMTPSRIHLMLKYYEPNRRRGLLVPRARKVMRIMIPISVGLIVLISLFGNYLMVASGGTGLVLAVSIALQMHTTFKQFMKREKIRDKPIEFLLKTLKKVPSVV